MRRPQLQAQAEAGDQDAADLHHHVIALLHDAQLHVTSESDPGTGNISPVSETARGLQALQMAIDLVFIGFAVALVLARYSDLLSSPRELPPDDAVQPGSRQLPPAVARPRMRTRPVSTAPIIRQMSARRRRRQLRGRQRSS